LIDLVAPVEITSSVLSVSTSENTHTNSIMDEPIDAVEEGMLVLSHSLVWVVL